MSGVVSQKKKKKPTPKATINKTDKKRPMFLRIFTKESLYKRRITNQAPLHL